MAEADSGFQDPLDIESAIRRGEDPRLQARNERRNTNISTIRPLVEWEIERVESRARIVRHHMRRAPKSNLAQKIELIALLLGEIAHDRQLYPISPLDAVYTEMEEDLADWLLAFIGNPNSTSPEHPALCGDEQEVEVGTMQVYLRCRREGSPADYAEEMTRFIEKHPAYEPDVAPKMESLPIGSATNGEPVYSWYAGQTIRTTPLGRMEDDDVSRYVGVVFSRLVRR
jgi:hypothetical protein